MTPRPSPPRTRWWFSLTLLLAYLAVFHLWLGLQRAGILASGAVVTVGLAALFWRALLSGYFVNRWDALGHAAVIVDLALEAGVVRWHDHVGFYLCALAFAAVVGGYRAAAAQGAGAGSVAGAKSLPQIPIASRPALVKAPTAKPAAP